MTPKPKSGSGPMTIMSKSESVYRTAAVFLAGIVLAGCTSWFMYPKNAVTRDELEKLYPRNVVTRDDLEKMMPGFIAQYSPYTQDQKDLSSRLQSLHDEQIKQGAQIGQMADDISQISAKVGVTAHPSPRR